MRWFLAMLLVVVVLPLKAQENDGAKLFHEFEKKLIEAKAYRVTLHTKNIEHISSGAGGFLFPSTSPVVWSASTTELLVFGNKLKGKVKTYEKGVTVEDYASITTYVCDGNGFVRTYWIERGEQKSKPFTKQWKPSPDLGKSVASGLARYGYGMISKGAVWPDPKIKNWMSGLKMTGFKLAGKEKVDNKEANLVIFNLEVGDKKVPVICRVWFDAKTNMPVKRSVGVAGFETTVETYSRWEIDPKIDEGTFTLPK